MELLRINSLRTYFQTSHGILKAVDGVDLSLQSGEMTCLIGESGSGKTVTAMSILGVIDSMPGIIGGEIIYKRKNLLEGLDLFVKDGGSKRDPTILKNYSSWNKVYRKNMEGIRGKMIGLVFQDPMDSLHPLFTIGRQMVETLLRNQICKDKREAYNKSLEWLNRVRLNEPEKIMGSYSFQLSGGMAQRVMLALALCANPELLIADEPTTALDATIQLEILNLLKELQSRYGLTILFITHDIAIAANYADKIAIMYSGKVVEYGSMPGVLFSDVVHPYTRVLLNSLLSSNIKKEKHSGGFGLPQSDQGRGCIYHSKCSFIKNGTHLEHWCKRMEPPDFGLNNDHNIKC
ncbi:MAG: ABC transporter ATP-binding protein, partial [Bacillota bacterium]